MADIEKITQIGLVPAELINDLRPDPRLCTFISNCVTTGDKIVLVSFSDSYADEDKSGIRVAQYLTELPSKEVLLRQLQKSLVVAKETNQSHPSD